MVVGEDLGTVPEGFRAEMSAADILGYRVLLLEREGTSFRPAAFYPARAMACAATHDLPPLAGWWEGADIRESEALGLPGASAAVARDERAAERKALVDALVREGCLARPVSGELSTEAVVVAAHAFVSATPSDLVLVQADDLAGARIGVNLPGTDTERPNWRRILASPVEELFTGDTPRKILDAVRSGGRATKT
jgi:4-alpha-glucanotransferase